MPNTTSLKLLRHTSKILFITLLAITRLASADPTELTLTANQLDWVGQQIYQNECASRPACLVHWNEGEAFPSLGIGHFIWYPAGVEEPFVESFPGLIENYRQAGTPMPEWLANLEPFHAPWPNREAFIAEADSLKIAELRMLLETTQGQQAAHIFERAQRAMADVINAAPTAEQTRLKQHLEALSQTPGGVYALIDYVNFKGEGLAPTERYHGKGWGLLQVLQAMDDQGQQPALVQFREAADQVLTRRAELAENPIERERWLPGWRNRLGTYREP
ncbi:MAG: hypothetical protein LAT65_00730 [Saccharospirillum sp.]|nr:hypothetical protein [Saccharospirillum sp.]